MNDKLTIPVSIVLGCIVLAVSFYFVQIDKRASIEKQKEAENTILKQKQVLFEQQQEKDNALSELKIKQAECESLSSGVKDKWNNVMGVTYDNDFYEACVVTYTDTKTGSVEIAPLSSMKTN